MWVDLDIWNDHLQWGFHINITLVRVKRKAPLQSLLSPVLISDWSIDPQSPSLIGRLAAEKGIFLDISSSHLVLNSTGSDASGGQPEAPPCDTNLQYVYNGPTPIQVSLMKYLSGVLPTTSHALGVFQKEGFTEVLLPQPWIVSSNDESTSAHSGTSKSGIEGGVGGILPAAQHLHSTSRYCR